MTTAPARIRWSEDASLSVWSGYVGKLSEQLFTIAAPLPDSGRGYLLMSRLPGMDFSSSRSRLEEAQAAAESWLGEFVSSLGAVFPDGAYEFEEDDEPLEVKYAAGKRVHYVHPDYGYPGEQEAAAALLVFGAAYTIAAFQIGQSRTDLVLEGIPGEWFNSVLFEPVPAKPAKEAGQ